jgi:GAF domain-containing protein
VEVLRTLNLLDTGSEESFDRITEACSKILHVPVALVSLVDTDRQWFKSRCGLAASETSRDVAFCAHVINQTEPGVFMVPDATKDERFKYSSLVNGPPHIRFYAGAALEYTDEHGDQWKLETLCVIDMKPRKLSAEEQVMLTTLARLVVAEIQLRKKMVKEQEEELHRRAKEHSQELEVAREGAHDVAKDLKAHRAGGARPANAAQLFLARASSTRYHPTVAGTARHRRHDASVVRAHASDVPEGSRPHPHPP